MNKPETNKEAAVSFLQLVAGGRVREAFANHVGAGFRHHNPYFKGDVESIMVAMEENAVQNPGTLLEVQRALQDGDLVAVHSRIRQHADDLGFAVVHICRFFHGRIVEMWDVAMAQPAESPNEHGMF